MTDNSPANTSNSTGNSPGTSSRIVERSLPTYEGERTGHFAAIITITVTSLRHVLGLGRPARHKVLPALVLFIAYMPAIVLAAINLLGSTSGGIPTDNANEYADYYYAIIFAILLFTALVSPEILTADRSNGMLPLYLSTPLTRNEYLIAKAVGLASVLSVATLGPLLLLLVNYTAVGEGPASFANWMATLGRILISGLAVAVLYTAVALGITALTKRRSVASVVIVLLYLVFGVAINVLVEEADFSSYLYLISISDLSTDLVWHIFSYVQGPAVSDTANDSAYLAETGTVVIVAACLAWMLAGGLTTWAGYRKVTSQL